jgi:hypothetical protein
LEVVSELEKLDDGIDPSMVQENKKVKPKRRFSIKEPPAPDPPVTKLVKSSKRLSINATLPPANTTPPTPKPQIDTTPPTPKPQIDTTPTTPKPQIDTTPPTPKPQVVATPPPKPQIDTTPPPPKPQVVATPPPKPQIDTTPPPSKPQVVATPPPKPQINTTPPPLQKPQVKTTPPPQINTPPKPQINIPPKPQQSKPQINTPPKPTLPKPKSNITPPPPPSSIITTKSSTLTVPNIKPRSRSPLRSSETTIIEEDEEGDSTRISSPVGSETSTISVTYQSPISKSFTSSVLKSGSPRSPSPNKKLNKLKEKSPVRQSRPINKTPIGRAVSKSPSRKSLTRAMSPNFTTREPRASRRSASVSLPRDTPKFLRRAQTLTPPQPRLSSPIRCLSPKKPNNRRHSTSVISVINSPLQFNAQSSLIGMWSNTSDRREDPTKKIIDELLSLFMETYEVDPGDSLLKSVQEFLENQEEETTKIFDWLLTTQLSLQYEILLGYFYLNGIGTSVANRKAFVLFLNAAKKQYAIAQDLLGYCYLNGKGTVKDEILAFEWYQKAAANGCVTAFQSLGECYHNGTGGVKNKSKALQYFKLASDGGNVCGKNMLAYCYEMGLGISSDHKRAFMLYKQAADAGYKLAIQNVAKCYQKGIGVAVDLEAAAYWIEKVN